MILTLVAQEGQVPCMETANLSICLLATLHSCVIYIISFSFHSRIPNRNSSEKIRTPFSKHLHLTGLPNHYLKLLKTSATATTNHYILHLARIEILLISLDIHALNKYMFHGLSCESLEHQYVLEQRRKDKELFLMKQYKRNKTLTPV